MNVDCFFVFQRKQLEYPESSSAPPTKKVTPKPSVPESNGSVRNKLNFVQCKETN